MDPSLRDQLATFSLVTPLAYRSAQGQHRIYLITMVVRLRLARHGTRNNPFYHIVAIADHKPRDARPIEKLGEYDPIPRPVLVRPQPRWAPQMANITRPRLPVDAIIGGGGSSSRPSGSSSGKGKGKIIDPYDHAGKVLTSGIAEPNEWKMEKRIEWNSERIGYWLGVGAQPSKPVARLLDKVSSAFLLDRA